MSEADSKIHRLGSNEDVRYETDEAVTYEAKDGVAWLMLNRPKFNNAQNGQMLTALDDAFKRAIDDDSIVAIVLGGEGKHFSAGHDIGSPGEDSHLNTDRRLLLHGHADKPGVEFMYAREQELYLGLCRRWQDAPKPTVAMVQGACVAGGLMLAWVCDLIIASDDAFFQDPVQPMMGIPGVEYFAHAHELPARIAKEFLLLGERMSAERAHHFGMVNRIVPRDQLKEETAKVAQKLAAQDRMGLWLSKQAINYAEDARGKRLTMDMAFQMHHLAHAHNVLMTGNVIGGQDAKSMAKANKKNAK